jgi:2,3-bisphosphoglycerate-independent phosphoglycerate mutase
MVKPIALIILDGWGIAPPGPGNAISLARLTNIPKYWNNYPHTELVASGISVGLPEGEDGNTETGHINIGAGRVVYQDLPRINMAISDGSFFQNEAFVSAVRYTAQHHSNIHLIGLLSDSGVHASSEHLYAILTLIKNQGGQSPVYLHLFTDGRDSSPTAARRFVAEVEVKCSTIGIGKIATIMGRYYGMDRDNRWERTEKAYSALTEPINCRATCARAAIETAYAESKTDEFIEPTIINDSSGQPTPRIAAGDAVIFYNYRIDRPRQLTRAFVLPNFEESGARIAYDPYAVKYFHKHIVEEDTRSKPFRRKIIIPNLYFVTMTEYERDLPCIVAYPPQAVRAPLASVFSDVGLRQLHASETEKERFVTYYFNGLRELAFPGEDRLIVPSPKVPTYDLKPDMSANELTTRVIERIALNMYSFIVINYANPDMVAHSGNISAAVAACEAVDECVGRLVNALGVAGGTCVITADHGNVEEMLGASGEMDTEHSIYPVPFIMIDEKLMQYPHKVLKGKLADIAPTILSYKKLSIPTEMTGKNLLADLPIYSPVR